MIPLMHILDGKKLRDEIRERLKKEVEGFLKKPVLSIIQVGDLPESNSYIDSKKKFGEKIGVKVIHEKYEADISPEKIIERIKTLNVDSAVSGILVQLPLPANFDVDKIMNEIHSSKDVDGLGAVNVKHLWEGKKDAFIPATTRGIMSLLEHNDVTISGKHVLVIGRSSLVGKPTSLAFLMKDATVTMAHSKTKDLEKFIKIADIVVVAVGKPRFISASLVSSNNVIIDVGINSVQKEKDIKMILQDEISEKVLVGDVDFENVKDVVRAISPVPGGVGPMTVASLFENVVEAYKHLKKSI